MFKRFSLVPVLLVWLFGFAHAQSAAPNQGQAPTGPIDEIIVQGAENAVELQGLIKVSVNVSTGDPIENVKPDEIKQQVLELGYFKTVTVELRVSEGKNQVVIRVELNPRISEVAFKGNSVVPSGALVDFLDKQLNIAAGTIANNTRLNDARGALAQAYRQSIFPFAPKVTLEQTPNPDGTVTVTYSIDESAAVTSLEVQGATLVPTKEIEAAFAELRQKGLFDARLYVTALQAVGQMYTKLGYRGSGVNVETTELIDGKLTVQIAELKVVAVDATAIGLEPDRLSVKVGDFFNYDKLLADLQVFAKDRDQQIQLQVEQVSRETVAVTIALGAAPAGPIKDIKIEGNTVIPTDKLRSLIRQKVGDTYNAQVAAEIDFAAIFAAYDELGYFIVGQPVLDFKDGVYTIGVQEQKFVGYELQWRGNHRTQDFVIMRELPPVGTLISRTTLQRAFGRIQQLGILRDARPLFRVPDPQKPAEVIMVLELEEQSTAEFLPGFGYNSLTGFEGTISFRDVNLWGAGHQVRLQLQANPNDAGQVVSGGASYTIPWLYLDFLDFQRTPTAVTFSISSDIIRSGQEFDKGTFPTPVDDPSTPNVDESKEPRRFTVRNSGISLSLTRPIGDNFSVSLSYSLNLEQNFLEVKSGVNYTTPDATAQAALPGDSLTNFVQLAGTYSTKNRQDFPTGGVVLSSAVGYGFGSQGATGLSWTRWTVGVRSYLGFGFDQNGEFGLGEDRNIALAGRFSTGVIFGTAPTNSQFRLGDIPTGNDDFGLRGYSFGDLKGNVFYSGSVELRYDFGLKTSFTYGLLGILFVDFGNAWDGVNNPSFGLRVGYGFGVQINIGFGALQLPPLGFFYAFSERNPSGKFHFTFGFRF
jgi:outer membrane protein insertion porin family